MYNYEKPNDLRGLLLMNRAAEDVVKAFPDIWLAYGQSDEYSFVLQKNSTLFGRRAEKIVSCIVSCFSSSFALNFTEFFKDQKLQTVPMFDGRCICYPTDQNLRDYLSWRQADCHVNNLYNTCFWQLVLVDKITTEEAHKQLKGTLSGQKNELLFSKYKINYNSLEAIYRKGTILLRSVKPPVVKVPKPKNVNKNKEDDKSLPIEEVKVAESEPINPKDLIEDKKSLDETKIPVTIPEVEIKPSIVILHEDLIGDAFWIKYKEQGLVPL
jgi:tRNA(His) guanylyltransferase